MADELKTFIITSGHEGAEFSVSDKDLNSIEVARGYAIKMLLTRDMDIQTITFKTYSRGLDINDIVSIVLPEYNIPNDITKNRIIVTEVATEYVGAKALDTIKGIRYD